LGGGTTSLFTDIVGSTELAVQIGDRAWAELLEQHHAAVRTQLDAFGGREMDTAGDGFFAVFTDAPGALEAATAIQGALRPLGLAVRVGLHTGDCYVVDDKCTGLAIHICARIVSLAEPGEVLVSESVREEAGPRFAFVGRGTRALRGIPGEWRLFALVGGS
jgi:class 3 adenylate cyclase